MARIAGLALALIAASCGPAPHPFVDDVAAPSDARADAAGDAEAGACSSNAGCDDGLSCTTDLCLIGGVCQHTSTCAAGQFCGAAGCGATRTCAHDADCDDGVACTRDVCGAGGACQNLRDDTQCDTGSGQVCSATLGCVARGRCGGDADCDDGHYCDGAERCASGSCQAGTPPSCASGMSCVVDSCDEATRMCVHTPLDPCGGSVTPGTYSLTPPPAYTCMAGAMSVDATVALATPSGGVSVTGFRVNGTAVTLAGAAPAMGMFSVTGMLASGGCSWTVQLAASFTTAGHFSGSWSVALNDCAVGSGDCFGGTGLTDGTMH